MHQCPDILSAHHFLQVAVGIHIEYDDREVVLFTHRGSGQVHYLQAPGIDLIIRNIGELGSRRIFLRISGVNTVTRVPFSMTSASISIPLKEDPVSVVRTDYPYRRT